MLNFILAVTASIGTDYFIRNQNKLSTTWIRKIVLSVGLVPMLAVLVAMTQVGCQAPLIVGLLCTAYGFSGIAAICGTPVLVDIAPRFAGTLHGVADTFYSACGFAVPLMCSERGFSFLASNFLTLNYPSL